MMALAEHCAELAKGFTPTNEVFGSKLPGPINAAPQHHYVLEAGLAALDRWIATGRPPASTPLISVIDGARPALVLDKAGNATGGIRSPWMDVPIERLSGAPRGSDGLASLLGSTEPLDSATLARLYPGGKADYLAKFAVALDRAIRAGHILPVDRPEILSVAALLYPK